MLTEIRNKHLLINIFFHNNISNILITNYENIFMIPGKIITDKKKTCLFTGRMTIAVSLDQLHQVKLTKYLRSDLRLSSPQAGHPEALCLGPGLGHCLSKLKESLT